MEKFLARNIVAGHSQTLGLKNIQLILPTAKHYTVHAVKNGEDVLDEKILLEHASRRKKSEVFHKLPYVSQLLPRTLQHTLSKSQYPLSQGLVLRPNDCFTIENYEHQPPTPKSALDVLTSKTMFSHNASQACYEWHPTSTVCLPRVLGVR